KRKTNDHSNSAADGTGDDPGDANKEKIQPKEARNQAGGDELREPALQVIDTADEFRVEAIPADDAAEVVDDLEPGPVAAHLVHAQEKDSVFAIAAHEAARDARVFGFVHETKE